MKNILVVAALFAATAASVARADDDRPGKDWMPMSTVASKLHDMGYDPIAKIEADDGMWEAKAYKGDDLFKVKLDPVTGRVVEERRKGDKHADKGAKDKTDD